MSVRTVSEVRSLINHGLEVAGGMRGVNPEGRFTRFRAIAAGPEQDSDRVLVRFAVKSLGFTAFSAYAKARDSGYTGPPREVVRNSTGLLQLAYLGHLEEQLQQMGCSVFDRATGRPVLDPALLVFKPGTPEVDFSEAYRQDIDQLTLPDRGCPIKGPVLERMYQEFVDVIFEE